MHARYAVAFTAAAWIAVLGTAALRRLARKQSTVADVDGGSWSRQLRSTGGVVVAGAALAGWLVAPGLSGRLAVTALAAVALTLYGLADERRRPRLLLVAEVVGAVAVVAVGVRIDATGSTVPDDALTVAWIVLVTSAVRRLDHADGLAASTVLASTAGLFAIAGFGDDGMVAVAAVSLVGACLGFLVYNLRPASVYLRDAGGLFLAFVVAVLAVEVEPAVAAPGSFLVPVLLLAMPALDLAFVTVGRFARGLPLGAGRPDHLVHRLSALGLSRGRAVLVLFSAQLVMCVLAVFLARGVLPTLVALSLGVAVVGGLTLGALPGEVYKRKRSPLPGARRRVLVWAGVAFAVVTLPAGIAVVDAYRNLGKARDAIETALGAARAGDTETSQAAFARAAAAFGRAEDLLGGPLAFVPRAVPVVANNLRSTRELAGLGADVAAAGERLAASTGPDELRVVGGRLPLEVVERVTPELERDSALLTDAVARVDELRDPFLIGPVRRALTAVDDELTAADREARNGLAAARLAPEIFGEGGPRRYFLAIQNPAEQRGTGGLIGSWGILTATDGEVTLEFVERTNALNEFGVTSEESSRTLDGAPTEYVQRYERFGPAQVWQNLNMSPDFPTVGQVIASLYPQSGGEPVDGVMAVDPLGLAALLELTGPITVEGWPEPLGPDNVVDVTLRQAYDAFGADPARGEFLGDVAEVAVDVATEGDLGSPARIAQTLGRAAREGHFLFWFTRPEEQRLADQLQVAGRVPAVRSDSLFVTTQNAAGNKVDYYQRRTLQYTIRLDPDVSGDVAQVEGRVGLSLENRAPPNTPSFALGPFDARFQPGENRSFVSVYTPLGFTSATVDEVPASLEAGTELGRNVFSVFQPVLAGESGTLALEVAGAVRLDAGWYWLDLLRQPGLVPDTVHLTLELPEGWRFAETLGLVQERGQATRTLRLDEPERVGVRVERERNDNIWEQLAHGPEG